MPWTGRKSDSLVCSQHFCERSHVVIFTSDLPLQEACLGNHVLGLCILIPAVLCFFFPLMHVLGLLSDGNTMLFDT